MLPPYRYFFAERKEKRFNSPVLIVYLIKSPVLSQIRKEIAFDFKKRCPDNLLIDVNGTNPLCLIRLIR